MLTPPLNGQYLNSGTWSSNYPGDTYYSFNDKSSKYYNWNSQGVWADSDGYSGWWFNSPDDVTYQGKDYIGSAAIVIDANENGVYDSNDYVIGHTYALDEDAMSGTWERDPGQPYGNVDGGAFGLFEVDVELRYVGDNKRNKVLGGLKKDVFKTKGGKDYIFAGQGNDKIYAGSGKDKVLGGLGNDLIVAGSGNDLITGGLGKDKIKGGKGKDIFKLSKGKGYDIIQDFKDKKDKIFIGSSKNLKLKEKKGDTFIYKGKDLLAKVKDSSGDLSTKGKYLV